MTRTEFNAIIADIEKHFEGEGYWISVRAHSGASFEGGWQEIPSPATITGVPANVIILSRTDLPPFYIPLSAIESIQLSAR